MLIGTLVFAVIAVSLRVISLMKEFEPETNLLNRTSPYSYILLAVSAVFILLAVLLIRRWKDSPEVKDRALTTVWIVMEAAAVLSILSSGVLLLGRFFGIGDYADNGGLSFLVLAIFALLCAAANCFIAVAAFKGRLTRNYGIFFLVTVLWSSYNLIIDFWNRSGNPSLHTYLYSMMTYVSFSLLMYYTATCFFTGEKKNHAVIWAYISVFFACISLFAPVISSLLSKNQPLPAAANMLNRDALVYVFIFFHSLVLIPMHDKNLLSGIYSEKTEGEEENTEIITGEVEENTDV